MFSGHYLPSFESVSTEHLFRKLKHAQPKLGILALVPENEKGHIPALQDLARQLDIPLMGAVFPALITGEGFQTAGINYICFDESPPWALIESLAIDSSQAAKTIADSIHKLLPATRQDVSPTLFMIFDGLLPSIGSILTKLFDRLSHRVRYCGINAGSESFQAIPCLFDRHRCVDQGMIGIILPETSEFVLEHGYPVSKALFRATTTNQNRIDQIDGRPALAVYQELIQQEFGINLTPENFYDYAVHYPFGLIGALDVLVRIPVGFTENGAIHCVGEVPPNSMLRLLHAPTLDESTCINGLSARMKSAPARDLITFYCAGRRMHYGQDASREIASLGELNDKAPLFGALSLGEIGTDAYFGIPQFQNAAIVCLR